MTEMNEPLDLPEEGYIPDQDEKTMAILSHVLTFVGGFIAPLIIYLVKKDESEFVRQHAVESLNFQISLMIYIFASIILMIVLIGAFLLAIIGIVAFILIIVATIKASEGKMYRYPLTIRLIQ